MEEIKKTCENCYFLMSDDPNEVYCDHPIICEDLGGWIPTIGTYETLESQLQQNKEELERYKKALELACCWLDERMPTNIIDCMQHFLAEAKQALSTPSKECK